MATRLRTTDLPSIDPAHAGAMDAFWATLTELAQRVHAATAGPALEAGTPRPAVSSAA